MGALKNKKTHEKSFLRSCSNTDINNIFLFKRHLTLIFIIVLLSCKNVQKEKESIDSSENAEVVKDQAGDLFENANKYFDNQKYEESRKELLILIKKFPASKVIDDAKLLLNRTNQELNKKRLEREKIRKEKEKKEKDKLEEAKKQMRIKIDELEDIVWYYDKSSPQYVNYNGFFLYVADLGIGYLSLRFRIQYKGDNWLFIQKYIIYIDGVKYKTIEPEYGDVKRDNGTGGVWEWIDLPVNEYNNETLNDKLIFEIISISTDVKIRLIGKNRIVDKTITENQKKAIKNVLEIYELLKK